MKLIHTSDLHLDSPLTARLSPREARIRKRELTLSFKNMIDEAKVIDARGVIIAGDLFDNERVGLETLDSIMGAIESAPEITFFYLPGNHEKDRLTASGIGLPENLRIFTSEWNVYDIDGVTVAGITDIDVGVFDTLKLDSGRINIVALHGELAEHSAAPDKIGMRELAKLPIDYLALGHYHTYSETKLSTRCTAVYSGTPDGRGFDETGDKGYVIIDTDGGEVRHRFVKRASRTLRIVEVDISGASREIDIENLVSTKLSDIDSRDLVRVVLCGEHEPGLRRDTEALTARFADSFFFLEIKDKSRLRIDAADYVNDKSLKGEFIRLVLAEESLSEEEKADVIECGIRALAGESLE